MENIDNKKGYKWGPILPSEIVTFTYPSGDKTNLLKIPHDVYFPVHVSQGGYIPDPRESFPKIRQMEIRSDDVFICAYPRSGQHFTFEIVKMLLDGKAEYSKIDKDSTHLELHLPEEFENVKSPRILSTHLGVNELPKQILTKKPKIVVVLRNPKDVAVSSFNFLKSSGLGQVKTWEDFLFMFKSDINITVPWFLHTIQYEKFKAENPELAIHFIFYENIRRNTIEELEKLSKFLGLHHSPKFIEEVATKIDFDKMKAAKIAIRLKELESVQAESPYIASKERFLESQTSGMYRKGQIGDWKNWFTVAQNEQFDIIFKEKMKETNLNFTWT